MKVDRWFIEGNIGRANFNCGPMGSLLSEECKGDGDAGHLEQAVAWLQLCMEPANTSSYEGHFLSV